MKTNKTNTINTLNGQWLDHTNHINTSFLNNELIIMMMNTEPLTREVLNTRRKPEAVAWEVLRFTANLYLKLNGFNTYASNEQLKSWLNEYGEGFDTLAETVEAIKAERAEMAD